MDDPNLKKAFLNSFLEPLGNETTKFMTSHNIPLQVASLRDMWYSLIALEWLCNQTKFLKQMETKGKKLGSACARKVLTIKCKDEKFCSCSKTKEKSHSKKFKSKDSLKKNKKRKFLTKKKFRGKTSSKCFVCVKYGHYSKKCPNKEQRQTSYNKLPSMQNLNSWI